MRGHVKNTVRSVLNRLGLDLVTYESMQRFEAFHLAARHAPDLIECAIKERQSQGSTARFIQIGSNDGVRDDNLRKHIIAHHLSGLMVEPNPGPFERLKALYDDTDGIALANCAVGPEAGEKTLYVFAERQEKGVPLDLYSAFDRQQLERVKRRNGYRSAIAPITVEVCTLQRLIEAHDLHDASLLVIDTEGFDLEILKSIDLQAFRPRLIQMEHYNLNGSAAREAVQRLVDTGYATSMGWRDLTGILQPGPNS